MENNVKQLIRDAFQAVFEDPHVDEKKIGEYFSEEYVQHVDGKTLDFKGFIQHLNNLKEKVTDVSIDFKELISDGNKACSVHIARATKSDGRKVEGKVIAFFEVKDGKIMLVDELTLMLNGDEADKELGSC